MAIWAGLVCSLLFGSACREAQAGEDFFYVLQPDAVTLGDLVAPAFRWLVLEPTVDGGASGDFTAGQIEQIRTGGPCTKRILAYLSIGEAEDYRDYWDPAWVDGAGNPIPGVAPTWLGPQNPGWPGNYKVRYWHAGWQNLMFGTPSGPDKTPLDRIIDQGINGVYLDIVDAYEFWSSPQGGSELPRMTARQHMIEFVEAIAQYARVTRGMPGFLAFPQNAAEIIRTDSDAFDALTDRYFSAVSGIGQEDLFYYELTPQPQAETDYLLAQLDEFRTRCKTVLVTDYVIRVNNPGPAVNDARVSDFYAKCAAQGFVPYAAYRDRDLNEVVTFSGPGWTYPQPDPGCLLPQDGDMNCDGSTDPSDIDGFVLALIDPTGCSSATPACYLDHADLNGDAMIDSRDLPGFVDALVNAP